jgi:hypothetical protein
MYIRLENNGFNSSNILSYFNEKQSLIPNEAQYNSDA